MSRGLTKRQEEILQFLKECVEEHGYPPTLREICAHFRMASTRAASDHLEALGRKGYIVRSPDRSRAISFPGFSSRVMRGVPLLGRIAAGQPMLAEENILARYTLDESLTRHEGSFMLKVEGDSMIGSHICPGDYIIVKPQNTAEDGEIVVALLGEEATVKRLEKKGGRIRLLPDNPRYEPVPIPDPEQFKVLGIVTGLVRQLR